MTFRVKMPVTRVVDGKRVLVQAKDHQGNPLFDAKGKPLIATELVLEAEARKRGYTGVGSLGTGKKYVGLTPPGSDPKKQAHGLAKAVNEHLQSHAQPPAELPCEPEVAPAQPVEPVKASEAVAEAPSLSAPPEGSKLCKCGCGKSFIPRSPAQLYAEKSCPRGNKGK